jgi:hypothetical protein
MSKCKHSKALYWDCSDDGRGSTWYCPDCEIYFAIIDGVEIEDE